MLFSVVVDFGIQQLVIKKVSEQKELSKKYLGNFFAVELLLAIAVYAVLAIIAVENNYDPIVRNAILVGGLGMFLNALSIPFTAIISAHEDMHILAVVNFCDSIINVGLMFVTILFHKSIMVLSMVTLLMAIMHLIVYRIVIKRYVEKPELFKQFKDLDWGLVKNMFKLALPFGMLVGFSIIYNKIDVIILAHIRGYAETGLYTNAYKFMDLLAFFPGVVSSSLYPFISSALFKKEGDSIRSYLEKYTKYMIGIAAPLAIGGAVLAPKLILLIGGNQFYDAFRALQILLFASATLFIYSVVNSVMISQMTRYAAAITFINIFINILGNIILIPRYGFVAAAVMTVISEFIQACVYFYFVQKRIVSFPVLKHFVKPIIGAVIMGFVLYQVRFTSLIFTIPLGAVIYGTLMILFRFVKKADLLSVKDVLRGRAAV